MPGKKRKTRRDKTLKCTACNKDSGVKRSKDLPKNWMTTMGLTPKRKGDPGIMGGVYCPFHTKTLIIPNLGKVKAADTLKMTKHRKVMPDKDFYILHTGPPVIDIPGKFDFPDKLPDKGSVVASAYKDLLDALENYFGVKVWIIGSTENPPPGMTGIAVMVGKREFFVEVVDGDINLYKLVVSPNWKLLSEK